MNYPFSRKRPNPKRDDPRRVQGREKLYGEAKTDRRREIFERSGGRCEAMIEKRNTWAISSNITGFDYFRCNAPITWETMEWSHDRHAANKDDSMGTGIASCKACHSAKHNAQGVPRRPGKVMRLAKAEEYWRGTTCFCNGEKRKQESLCSSCGTKISAQTLYTLENTDDRDIYRQALAEAETEILNYEIKAS